MKPTVAILSIGMEPVDEIRTVLTEHVVEEKITHVSLLGDMSRKEMTEQFAPDDSEEPHHVLLSHNQLIYVNRDKIFSAMQKLVSSLDSRGYEVILFINTLPLSGLRAQNTILLDSDRLVPPLIASIVGSHNAGIILPFPELIRSQQNKWCVLAKKPIYEVANPNDDSDEELLSAGQQLIERGATVIILDYLVFTHCHQQWLEEQLDIPVLLSNMLVARLASELLV